MPQNIGMGRESLMSLDQQCLSLADLELFRSYVHAYLDVIADAERMYSHLAPERRARVEERAGKDPVADAHDAICHALTAVSTEARAASRERAAHVNEILGRLFGCVAEEAAHGVAGAEMDMVRNIVEFVAGLGARSREQVRFFGSRSQSRSASVSYLVCELRYDQRKGQRVTEARHTFRLPPELLRDLDLDTD